MVKKDKKAKTAEKKARVAQKAEKKATQKEKKVSSKKKTSAGNDGTGGNDDDSDVDIDTVLADYARQQEAFLKITETPGEPPSARGSATLLASPANENELFLFGGEYYNGALAKFYNDLYAYRIKQDEWVKVTSPNSPLPRSGHAWTRGGNAGGVYLFGGEFSSPKQGTFHHYANDFWHLDPSSREWTKLEAKSRNATPPARSGHRMTYYKQYIVLFGGFQDTSQQTKYLSDLWLYDCANYTWHCPAPPPASPRPDPRSSFSFLPHESGAVLYGGYSRVKAAAKSVKGTAGAQMVMKPMVHTDTWFLRIVAPASDAPSSAGPTVRWERRKKPVNAPAPPRAGTTMAYHKGRGLQFGGVHDVEEDEEGIESEFFNTLLVWNVERNRYFPLGLRRPRAGASAAARKPVDRGRARGKKDEEDLLENLKRLEMKMEVTEASSTERPSIQATGESDGEEEDEPKIAKNVIWEMPHPRFNAQLTVQDDVLYIYGGTFEKGDREYTFDEMWAIDLGKLDGAKEIYKREVEDWAGSDSEDEEDEDDEDDDEGDDEDDNETLVEGESTTAANVVTPRKDLDHARRPGTPDSDAMSGTTATATAAAATGTNDPEAGERDNGGDGEDGGGGDGDGDDNDDGLPHPRPFESLREFFARTSERWQQAVLDKYKYGGSSAAAEATRSVKGIRKTAFDAAEAKWWDCREEIRRLEDEREAAGIGEVVNLAEKGGPGGSGNMTGAGRRR